MVVAAAGLASFSVQARSKNTHKKSNDTSFDYFMLVLSYAPDFCAQPNANQSPRECGSGRHVGFVVHGLWPQDETSRGPENCGPASPVSQATIQQMLAYFPTESLIQHEWRAHGTCSGLSVNDYFAAVRKSRDAVKIPPELTPSTQQTMAPADVQSAVAVANPSYPKEAFRTSCYRDSELQEVRICLNKDLSPRACGVSAGQCAAKNIILLPVR